MPHRGQPGLNCCPGTRFLQALGLHAGTFSEAPEFAKYQCCQQIICVTHTSNRAACKHSKIAYKLCWSLQGLTRFEIFPKSQLLETFIAWRAALDTETSLSANAAPAAAAASEMPRLSCGPCHVRPHRRCQVSKNPGVGFLLRRPHVWDRTFSTKNVYQKLVGWRCVCNLSRLKGSNHLLSLWSGTWTSPWCHAFTGLSLIW